MTTEPTPIAELTYTQALAELEATLDRLERDEPDVDRLAADVARASELVAHLRDRISSARLRVEEVITTMSGPPAPSTDERADRDEDVDS